MLLLGTVASLGVAISVGVRKRILTIVGKIGVALFLLVVVYHVLLLLFPYLRYWPELLGW